MVDIIPYPSFKSGGNLTTNDEATYCKGATSVRKLKVDVQQGNGSPVYQWYKATSPMGIGQEIARAWSNEYTPDVSEAGTFYYYVTVRNQQYCTEELTSYKAKIVVNETTAIVDDLSEDEVKYCKGVTATALTVKMKGTPNYTYTWYRARNTTETGTVVRTQTSATAVQDSYTPSAADEGTFYYYVVVHSSCGADKTSKRAKITITKHTAIKTDGNLSTTEVEYCKNATPTALTVKVEGTAPFTYKWYKADNATDAGQEVRTENNSNSNEDSYTPVVTTVGTAYYYVKITGHCGAEVTSNRAKITITKPTGFKPNGNLDTDEVKYCKGATNVEPLSVEAEGTGNLTYQWYLKNDNYPLGTPIAGQTTATLAASAIEVGTRGTTYYYVVVHSDCGSDVTSARAKVTITDPDTPTVSAQTFCNAATVANLAPQGTDIKWYDAAAGGSLLTSTTALVHNNKYYVAKVQGGCESARAEVTVTIISLAQPIVSEDTAATCTTISKAKITNVKPTTQVASYTFVNTETNRTVSATVDRTTGEISNLPVGKYKVTAIQEGCEKQSDEFEIEGFKAKPDQPKVSTEAQCDNPSKAKITNVKPDTEVTGYTFKNVETSAIVTATVDRTTGEVSALPVGKYKVTATNSDGCTQESDLFEIKAAKGHPDKPVLSTTESCNTLSLAKIENYQSSQSYTFVKADGTPLTGITVATNGVVNNLTIGTYKVKTTREGCDSDLSDTFEIKPKKAATAITTQPQGHNYAKNATAAAITVAATGEGNLRYKWFMNTTNSRTGADVTEITTATTARYTPATRTVGSLFYWVEVTGDCGTLKSDIVEIKVTENIAPIEANDDTATVRRGQSVPVLPNDFAGGNPATLTNVTIAIDSNDGLTGATIDQGRIKVPTNATPRTYNVVYKICLVSDPNTCKNATAKITVTNDPAYTIEANDDPLTRVAKGGTVNVLSNDQVNGNPATPTALDMTIEDNGGLANLEVNTATGKLKVPAGATSGTYEVTYRICVKGEASPCDTAKVKIEVTSDAAPTTTINANDDPNTSVAKGGLVEVLSNDRLNGEPVTKDKVTTTIDNDRGLTGVEIDPATGKIKVPVTATEGTYEVTYKICEKQNGTPCDTAKVKITVTSDVIHTIEANDDPEVTVGKGGTVTVLNNDTVDGNPATKDNVDISIDNNGGLTDLTTDPDGKIKVPANATPNTYEVTYRICVKGASSPCATAKVKIMVTNDTSTTIIANDDPLTYVAKGGTADVLSNDRLGGDPATKDNVIVTIDRRPYWCRYRYGHRQDQSACYRYRRNL